MQTRAASAPSTGSVLALPRFAGPPPARAAAPAEGGKALERSFSPEQISRLLWHALGLNRHGSGGRAAASSGRPQDLEIYVCLPDGGYRYDVPEHALYRVTPRDCRSMAGFHCGPATPALVLVYVDGGDAGEDSDCEESGRMPDADPATIAGNVAAYCAEAGLDARGGKWFTPQLASLFGLGPSRRVVLAQTVRARAKH